MHRVLKRGVTLWKKCVKETIVPVQTRLERITWANKYPCTSYHMAMRAFVNLSHEGTKRPSAIN